MTRVRDRYRLGVWAFLVKMAIRVTCYLLKKIVVTVFLY